MRLSYIIEKKEEKKKIVFDKTIDPQHPFPEDTFTALKKEINKSAKDLEKVWRNSIELVNKSFVALDVPIPGAYLQSRWLQYQDLIKIATQALASSRGVKGDWNLSV